MVSLRLLALLISGLALVACAALAGQGGATTGPQQAQATQGHKAAPRGRSQAGQAGPGSPAWTEQPRDHKRAGNYQENILANFTR